MKSVLKPHKLNQMIKSIYCKPICERDTLMSCISYWLYGTPANRIYVRSRLLLYFAHQCFNVKFESVSDIINSFMTNSVKYHPNVFVKDRSEAMKFIFTNMRPGIVSSSTIMCKIAARCIDIRITLKIYKTRRRKGFGNKEFAKAAMHLEYGRDKRFLLAYENKLKKTNTRSQFDLHAYIKPGNSEFVSSFDRVDDIHSIDVVNDVDCIYKITTKTSKKFYIFSHSLASETVEYISSSNNFGDSHFFIDNVPCKLLVVFAESRAVAKNLATFMPKIKYHEYNT